MTDKYHRDRLFTHTQEELLTHNERVKQIIPSEKLLTYEVGEGWERLVEFLGVYVFYYLLHPFVMYLMENYTVRQPHPNSAIPACQ